jgi:hypothetical protein
VACASVRTGDTSSPAGCFIFADEEVYEAGDAFYQPPGHRPYVDGHGTAAVQPDRRACGHRTSGRRVDERSAGSVVGRRRVVRPAGIGR